MKKKVLKLMIIVAIFGFLPNLSVNITQAASTKVTKKAALKAYKKMLGKNSISIEDVGDCNLNEDISFAVKDLNHDGIPELIIDTETVYGMSCMDVVYTYYKGKISFVTKTNHGYAESYSKGTVFATGQMNHGYGTLSIYSIQKGKAKEMAYYIDDTASGADEIEGIVYYVADKKTTKKKYNAYVKKLTKGTKSSSIKCHPLTKANIKKYVK